MAPDELKRKGVKTDKRRRAVPLGWSKVPALGRDCIVLIDAGDIFYISGAGDYTTIHTLEKNLLCSLTLNQLEMRLQDTFFFRAHRSFIANLEKCESICLAQGGRYLQLCDRARTKIPVSRSKAKMLRDFIGF